MKVLLLSKACVVGAYQKKLEEIAQHDGVELTVVVPPEWRDERGVLRLERAHTTGYDLRVQPIVLNGQFHLHFYPGLGRVIHQVQPDVVHIEEEPYKVEEDAVNTLRNKQRAFTRVSDKVAERLYFQTCTSIAEIVKNQSSDTTSQ